MQPGPSLHRQSRMTALIVGAILLGAVVLSTVVILVSLRPTTPPQYTVQVSTSPDSLGWSGSIYVESRTGSVTLWTKNYSGSGLATFSIPADASAACAGQNELLWARFWISNYQGNQTISVTILKNASPVVSSWAYGNDAASTGCPLS